MLPASGCVELNPPLAGWRWNVKITALEVLSHPLKKGFIGYDVREVETFRELVSETIEEMARDTAYLEEKKKELTETLSSHVDNENTLKGAITTTHQMAVDIKGSARKEADLIVAEARLQADEIINQARGHVARLSEEILRLKGQRIEMEVSVKALVDYHATRLIAEKEASDASDIESEKLKFIS